MTTLLTNFTAIMGRDVCQDITLSDGTFLPQGTFVVANAYQITHDPDVLQSSSDPDEFDGLRYYNLRNNLMKNGHAEKELAGKHQFVSISNSSLMFGYGKHACPGRFFAGNEVKLILAKLLLEFDIKLPPGESGRYKSKSWEVAVSLILETAMEMLGLIVCGRTIPTRRTVF